MKQMKVNSKASVWLPVKKCLRKARLLGGAALVGTSLFLMSLVVVQLFTLSPVYLRQVEWDPNQQHHYQQLSQSSNDDTSRGRILSPSIIIQSARADDTFNQGLKVCPGTRRPSPGNLRIRKGHWQVACHGCTSQVADIQSERTDSQTSSADGTLANKTTIRTLNEIANSSSELVAYSAYFDDRPLLGVSTWLRIIGVANLLNHSSPSNPRIHCQVWYEGYDVPYVTEVIASKTGREYGYRFTSDGSYVQYLFSCELPSVTPVPTHVSLVLGHKCSGATTLLPIQRPIRAAHDQEIGICIPISFGQIPPALFVEWMEAYRLLGIKEINLYESEMVNMTSLFDHYVREGFLVVHHMPPPVMLEVPTNTSSPAVRQRHASNIYQSVKLASPASLNDCMMRNVYRYKYVFVVDLDEFLLPKIHDTIPRMLNDILARRNTSLPLPERVSFRNAYFFKEAAPDESQPKHLMIARYRKKPRVEKVVVAPKSFVDPRTCLSIFNHFCYIPLPSLETPTKPRRPPLLDVSTNLATVQHYRRCELRGAVCPQMLNDLVGDDTSLRFMPRLRPRVEAMLDKLKVSYNQTKQ